MSEELKPCPLSRFWSKVDKTDSCWLWKGAAYEAGQKEKI